MVKKSNTVGIIIANVFITLIISGTCIYFGVPLLYPDLSDMGTEDDLDDYVLKDDKGVIVQSKYKEINSTDYIRDYNLTPMVIQDTEMNITTQGNTKLSVSFDAQFKLMLINNFESVASYNVTLQIEGVKQETVRIVEYRGEPIVGEEHMFIYLQISFETGILPAGTYEISVIWYSRMNTATLSQFDVGVALYDNVIRTLSAQEINV